MGSRPFRLNDLFKGEAAQRMLTMADTNDIRDMFFSEGRSKTSISKITGFDRKTITKYIEQEDWNNTLPDTRKRESKLDAFKAEIYKWIENDKLQRVKQRHTAFRVHTRLRELYPNTFNCSYKTVANYVAIVKKEVFSKSKGTLPLEHNPGEAQVDFGSADFIENGVRYSGKYLALSFPYSNAGYYQFFHGETYECLAQGMKNIFKNIGGVPYKIWFDNASSMVAGYKENGERKLTDSFLRFKNHYGFEAVFCNRGKGNEKGHVESKVGYFRRNFMVPIPEFNNLDSYNESIFSKCSNDMGRLHYEKKVSIQRLYEEDEEYLLELPANDFDVVTYTTSRVNNYGKLKLHNGKHTYSAVPREAGNVLSVGLRANTVTILDENYKEIVTHKRMFGDYEQESMDWIPYLEQISKYPTAFKYTGIYKMLPDPVNEYLDRLHKRERGKALQVLSRITEEADFNTGVEIFSKALNYKVNDSDSLVSIYYRDCSKFPLMETISVPPHIPELTPITTDTRKYDGFLKGELQNEH